VTTRRSVLGSILGAVMVKPKINFHSDAVKTSDGVEDGVEPLPQFPLMVVTRRVTGSGNYDRGIKLIVDRDAVTIFDYAYRNATSSLDDFTEYKVVTTNSIGTHSTGEFYFWAIKGQSGETMQVDF
jgi:hypothetical protein